MTQFKKEWPEKYNSPVLKQSLEEQGWKYISTNPKTHPPTFTHILTDTPKNLEVSAFFRIFTM